MSKCKTQTQSIGFECKKNMIAISGYLKVKKVMVTSQHTSKNMSDLFGKFEQKKTKLQLKRKNNRNSFITIIN